ncbi:13273_t:CDS:1, partial [Gigaspora margarita]
MGTKNLKYKARTQVVNMAKQTKKNINNTYMYCISNSREKGNAYQNEFQNKQGIQ